MARSAFRIPILKTIRFGRLICEIEFPLEIRLANGLFQSLTTLLDSGSQLTTISVADARRYGIPVSLATPVSVRGTTGTGRGFLSPLWFSFPQLPQWQFETLACFTSHPLSRCLMSLSDVLPHFAFRTVPQPITFSPASDLLFRLSANHGGQPRP